MRFRRLLAAAAAGFALSVAATADPSAPSGASLYNLDSKWTNQDGASVAFTSFAGELVVLAMGYTTCKAMCPAIVADMMWVEKHLPPARPHTFASPSSVSTLRPTRPKDSGSTPKATASISHWTLLRGDDDAVRELSAALDVPFRPNDQNGFEHAAVISLLDAKGEIVFQQRGAQASSDELLAKLRGLLLAGD